MTEFVRHQAAANLKPISDPEFRVGIDGREVYDLVETLIQAGRLNIVKNEAHPASPSELNR